MNRKLIALSGMIIASLGVASAADAQAWGPPPPPPYGYAPPPPPGPFPVPGPQVVQRWRFGEPGYHRYHRYHPRCWIEYRNNGWEMVKICQ